MRHTGIDGGFIMCWGLNLLLNWQIGALSFILWIAAEWFSLSIYPAAIAGGIWIFGTFLLTIFFSYISRCPSTVKENKDLPNVNPYSQRKK